MDPCVARVRDDSGVAVVEAALVLPVVILLVFAVIEFGFTFKDLLSVTSATRAGARTAVALSKRPNYQTDAAESVAGVLKNTMPSRGIELLVVYKADPETGAPVGGASFDQCTTCYRFTWAPNAEGGTGRWIRNGGDGWPARAQNACGDTAHTDYLGVYVRAHHDFITGLFGRRATLTDHTVMRLEPVPSENGCRAS